MNYLLGSGFYGGQKEREFALQWEYSLTRYTSVAPKEIFILAAGGSKPPIGLFDETDWPSPVVIGLSANLGHVGQLMSGEKTQQLCGWSAALLWLCMTAYNAELDVAFVEQDCLVFGDWFGKMMEDLGDGQWIFGHKHESEPFMWASNSIVYIRHEFLLTFIKEYIALGSDGEHDLVPETKFRRIELLYPLLTRRLSYGQDRTRPLDYDAPILYAQKLTNEELEEFRKRDRI